MSHCHISIFVEVGDL
uniref:Uncharacterized protein n=1 Tax=Anguilla anguilla TaxID=7936 RepID=A0A0E9Q8E1_ANGAN